MTIGARPLSSTPLGAATKGIAAGAGTSLTPGGGSLAITGQAPTIAQSANQTVAPAVGSVALAGYAPSVTQVSARNTATPGTGLLAIAGWPPLVVNSGVSTGAPGYKPKQTPKQKRAILQEVRESNMRAIAAAVSKPQIEAIQAHVDDDEEEELLMLFI